MIIRARIATRTRFTVSDADCPEPRNTVDQLLLSDDLVVFDPTFGAAIVVGTLALPVRGSALATSDGRALCLEGDVTSVAASVAYSTPSCPVPGSGRLTIESLDGEQLSSVVCDGGKPVVLAGGRLTAKLKVLTPALGPPPTSRPDTKKSYRGNARLQTTGFAPKGD